MSDVTTISVGEDYDVLVGHGVSSRVAEQLPEGVARVLVVHGAPLAALAEPVISSLRASGLEVHVAAVPDAEDGYLEVWLRDEAASRMISLGTVSTQDAVLTVPEGVRLAEYPVVDVSHEHFDGDPTHSGTSLWVGEMVRRS